MIHHTRVVHFTGTSPNEKVYDLAFTQAAKFAANGLTISLEKLSTPIVPGSQVMNAIKPDHSEMVLSNSGQIIDANLEPVTVLEQGTAFFQHVAYSEDGNTLFGTAFDLNQSVLRSYDTNDEYSLIERFPLNFSPSALFSDGDEVMAVGIVFLNGISRTIIAKFPYR